MADSVKNVTFRFKADTSQIMRIIDDLNKAINKTQNSLSTFKIGGDAKQIKQQLDSINKKLEIRADTNQAKKDLSQLNDEIKKVKATAEKPLKSTFLDTLKGGLAAFGIVATADALVDLGKSTIQAAIDFEKLTASFRALIGDKERADQAIKDIQQFALQTPFDVTQIAAAGKTLLGYGINVDDLISTLKQLGDVSAASGGDIQRVALAFGQVAAKGKLQGEEIRQLVNVGFNPLQEISKATGESMAALAKRVEEGRVSFDEVAEAFRIATSEGGRFFNLAATLNDTLGGQIQKLGEQVNLFKIEVGSIAGEDLRPLVEEITRLFVKITEFTQYLRQNALALGLVKAALGFVVALLFKSVNAFLANFIATKNWSGFLLSAQKNVLAFSFALKANTFAIGTNTTAQRTAAVATTVWDGATKVLTVTTNLFKSALTGLFNIIKTNPLGVLIAAYTILNALKERNAKLSRDEFLQQKGLIDIDAEIKKRELQTEAQIKAKSKVLEEDFKSTINTIRAKGLQNELSQKALSLLEKEYNLNLKGIKDRKDNDFNRNKSATELNKILGDQIQKYALLEKRAGVVADINRAEFDLTETIDKQTLAQEERKKLYEEIAKNSRIIKANEPLQTEAGPSAEAEQAAARIKKYEERIAELNKELDQFAINSERDIKALQKKRTELFDLNTLLLKYGDGIDDTNNKTKEEIDLLEKLRSAYGKLIDEITDLLLKQREQEINILPEDTEEQQIQKAFKSLQIQRDVNAAAQNEEQKNQEALLAEAIAGGANIQEATELFNKNLEVIRRKYNIKDENLLIAHNQKLYDIAQFWIDKNDKLIEEGRKAQSDELLRQLQRREQGFADLQSDIEERFLKAAPGGAKGLRQRFKDITAAIKDNLQEQLKIRKDERLREFNQERKDIDKLYTLRIQDIKGDDPQRKQKLKDYYEQRNEAMKTAGIKFNNDIKTMEQETADAQFDIEKANQEKLKQLERERKLYIIDQIQQTINFSIQAAQQIIDIEQRKNDELIAIQEERVQKARDIADKGNAALLEAEEKRLTELQKKRAKFVRAQQALVLAQTIAESALAIAKAAVDGGGWASAITIAATLAALGAGFAAAKAQSTAAIGGFAEGGWTGKGGKYEPAGVVHREEFVVKKGPAEKYRPLLEQMNRGRDPLLAKGMGQQVIMINNVGVEERLARIEKAITGQDRMQLTIDESGIHGLVSHYQWKNQRIRNKTK